MLRVLASSSRLVARRFASDAAAAGALPKKLNLFLTAPHDVFAQNEAVDAVYLPSREGVLGVMPGYEKTIAQLKPGVVAIHNGSSIKEYFVSGGFATIDGANAHVTVGEAVPIENLDSNAVSSSLAEFKQKAATAASDEDKFIAQTGVEVYEAMAFALQKK